MARYDSLLRGWRLSCPEQGSATVTLLQFRRIDPLAGSRRPPAYRVVYRCPVCAGQHQSLLAGPDLDLAPLFDPLPPYVDLQSTRPDWDASLVAELWSSSLRRGTWPLNLWCAQRGRQVGGWPSLLRALEPDDEQAPQRLLVHYRCPCCASDQCQHMRAQQLTLAPAGWS